MVERIKERLAALGISAREAGRRAGLGLGYIGDIIAGRSGDPTIINLSKLAAALDCDVDYLVGKQDTVRKAEVLAFTRHNAPPNQMAGYGGEPGLIDLYTAKSVSAECWFEMTDGRVAQVPGMPALRYVVGAYALIVPNNYMEPRYLTGECIFLSPAAMARIGDFVLIRRTSGEVTICQVAGLEADYVEISYLAGGQHCERSVPRGDIIAMHKIVGSAASH